MSHLCDRYFAKHGHFPRVVVTSGIQRITVEFAPGYISIRTSSPYQAEIHITRSAFLALLRKVLPVTRKWAKESHPDHDVPAAMREAYWNEVQILQEKRTMKKARTFDVEAESSRQRQRQRALRARERHSREDALRELDET